MNTLALVRRLSLRHTCQRTWGVGACCAACAAAAAVSGDANAPAEAEESHTVRNIAITAAVSVFAAVVLAPIAVRSYAGNVNRWNEAVHE